MARFASIREAKMIDLHFGTLYGQCRVLKRRALIPVSQALATRAQKPPFRSRVCDVKALPLGVAL